MGQHTSRPATEQASGSSAPENTASPSSASTQNLPSTTTTATTTAPVNAGTTSTATRETIATQPSPPRRSSVQNLRRRRSSSNTQSSLPPSRRRRMPSLRFWRGNNNNNNSTTHDEDDSSTTDPPHRVSLRDSAVLTESINNRFIEELDDIASHLSHTLQQLPSGTNTSNHLQRSNASINSDLSTSSPISFLHQTEMLSRLLEVAATSTVVTLMGSSLVNGRRFDNTSRNDDDNEPSDATFQEFVVALRNGLLANELSRNYDDHNRDNMTFFRAFRFDNDSNANGGTPPTGTPGSQSIPTSPTSRPTPPSQSEQPELQQESGAARTEIPPIPVMIVGVRSVQQGPEAFGNAMPDNSDWFAREGQNSQRQPQQAAGSTRTATTSATDQTADSASNSSENDRREEVQEPHPNPPQITQRSWVIFVMGNSFAWNHPLLTAPSLMNENPTYEDLLNLQELIGQVKPQVTTTEELNKHTDQLFELKLAEEVGVEFISKSKHQILDHSLSDSYERCQICLTDYENHDIVRKLSSCNHFYHEECIDTWLLNGKNNCPMCRSKGIPTESS